MYGKRRTSGTDTAHKSMGSYELFAWRDAMEMASWLEADFDVRAIRKAFERMSVQALVEYENNNHAIIAELLRKTPAQRPAYLRKVGKDVDAITRGLVVVFAIIALVRVKDLIELRDMYRSVLTPGGGNRATCSGLYEFQLDAAALSKFDWPDEVFDAYGGNGGFDED